MVSKKRLFQCVIRLFEEALATPVYRDPKLEERKRALEHLKEKGDLLLQPLHHIEEELGINKERDDYGKPLYYKEESIREFSKLREETDRKVQSLLKTLPDFEKGKGFVPLSPK